MNIAKTTAIRIFKGGLLALTLGLAAFATAQDKGYDANQSELTRSMGITQKLGDYVPMDVKFKEATGETVKFGDLFKHNRPVVVVPMFYACRTGCELITDSVLKTLAIANKSKNEMVVGRDLDIVILGIHPKETPELALAKKKLIISSVKPPNAHSDWEAYANNGWHLLTGDLDSIHKVTDAIGFKYKYDATKDLINHPTCTVFLSPKGQISSYIIGTDFPTSVAKSDLTLAAKDEVGEKADQSMMFGCVMLDPATGKYRVIIENVLRLACVLTLMILFGSIGWMTVTTNRRDKARAAANPKPTPGTRPV